MRDPLRVVFTIDTEVMPRNDDSGHWTAAELERHIRRDIYGETKGGNYGVPYQMDVFDAHGLKAVFFVEALFASAVGVEPLAEIVEMIQSRGHEVQLHLHPEWLAWIRGSDLPATAGDYVKDYSAEDQVLLIARGLDNLRQAGASDVCAFRAGNYGADFTTLRALASNNIKFDTSYNIGFIDDISSADTQCGLRLPTTLIQSQMIDGICEVPISHFVDYPGHRRHAQVCACSFREMQLALMKAWESGWDTFVIVSHSFEMLSRNSDGVPDAPDAIVIKRFEKLCRFLEENQDKFQTVGFSDLDPSSLVANSHSFTDEIRSNFSLTALRYGEQLIRRAW